MKIRHRILERLKELGWTQRDLSQKSGVSENTLTSYLKNNKDIRQETLKAICEALELNIVLIAKEDL